MSIVRNLVTTRPSGQAGRDGSRGFNNRLHTGVASVEHTNADYSLQRAAKVNSRPGARTLGRRASEKPAASSQNCATIFLLSRRMPLSQRSVFVAR